MVKKIPLVQWAAARYDPLPSAYIRHRWARDGEIHPKPEKVGPEWWVREDAVRVGTANHTARAPLAERVQS